MGHALGGTKRFILDPRDVERFAPNPRGIKASSGTGPSRV